MRRLGAPMRQSAGARWARAPALAGEQDARQPGGDAEAATRWVEEGGRVSGAESSSQFSQPARAPPASCRAHRTPRRQGLAGAAQRPSRAGSREARPRARGPACAHAAPVGRRRCRRLGAVAQSLERIEAAGQRRAPARRSGAAGPRATTPGDSCGATCTPCGCSARSAASRRRCAALPGRAAVRVPPGRGRAQQRRGADDDHQQPAQVVGSRACRSRPSSAGRTGRLRL